MKIYVYLRTDLFEIVVHSDNNFIKNSEVQKCSE